MQLIGNERETVNINGEDTTTTREVILTLGQVALIGEPPDTMIRVVLYFEGVPYGVYDISIGPVGEKEILNAVLENGLLPGFSVIEES
ncbi:TPA: hypothetical protein MYO83_002700 [Klebsiella michiganensis]|nr:hypothetical protein [Klebsiella michiganensis]HCB1845898.1 hypothetical protein [Klebsiella oxytoca]